MFLLLPSFVGALGDALHLSATRTGSGLLLDTGELHPCQPEAGGTNGDGTVFKV
jgi:hypothetical protein